MPDRRISPTASPDSRRLTRRAFHRQISGAAAAATALFGTRRCASAADTFPAVGFVDIHTHLGQTWNTTQPLSASELLRWMDAHHVDQAIVLPLTSPESSSYLITTDFVLLQTEPHRERLIPFCSIDPRTSYSGGQKGLTDMLRKYVEAGAKGFGEHKCGLPIDHPRSLAIYEACGELKLPVLFHLDNERNLDKPGLPGLDAALTKFPGTNFIGHGPGWWASISGGTTQADLGGYPKTPVQPGGAIDALMDKHANLYGDLSAGSGAGAISRDTEFGRKFLIRRAERLLFGTDFLAPGQGVPQFEVLEKVDLPKEVQQKIFRDNAHRLLGIKTAG